MAQVAEITKLEDLFAEADEAVNKLVGWAVVHGARDPKYHELVNAIARTMCYLSEAISDLLYDDDEE